MTPKDGSTRKKLIEAAYQVLAEKGYKATSVKEIAREAGVLLDCSIIILPTKKNCLSK